MVASHQPWEKKAKKWRRMFTWYTTAHYLVIGPRTVDATQDGRSEHRNIRDRPNAPERSHPKLPESLPTAAGQLQDYTTDWLA
jgi:hypothetical protein